MKKGVFVKGQKTGIGRKKLTVEQIAIKHALDSEKGRLLLGKYALKSYDELKRIIENGVAPNAKMRSIELFICRMLLYGIDKANLQVFQYMMDKLFKLEQDDSGDNHKIIKLNYNLEEPDGKTE